MDIQPGGSIRIISRVYPVVWIGDIQTQIRRKTWTLRDNIRLAHVAERHRRTGFVSLLPAHLELLAALELACRRASAARRAGAGVRVLRGR
jgi:hypothetical protein